MIVAFFILLVSGKGINYLTTVRLCEKKSITAVRFCHSSV
jgi:hypothetical protein